MTDTKALLAIAKRKCEYDKGKSWSEGARTYLEEIKKELSEVEDELGTGKTAHLEDELGDVLWDFCCALVNLESEENISSERVFERAEKKYAERVSGVEEGISWSETKKRQKARLEEEDATTS